MADPGAQSSKNVLKKINSIMKLKSSDVEEVDKNLLKYQNTALYTKLDFVKREVKTLKTINESLEMKVKNNETFLSVFSLAWNHFVSELEFVHMLLKKPEEDKHSEKLLNIFQFFDELFKYGDANKDASEDISKQIKVKSEIFLKNVQNIFTAIFIEYQKWHEKIASFSKEITTKEIHEMARRIFEENQELRKKLSEMEQSSNQLKNKLKELQSANSKLKEEKFQKDKMEIIYKENEDLKAMTENLTRRIRLLSEYSATGIEAIAASKVEKENYDCICGGKNILEAISFEALPVTLPSETIPLNETQNAKDNDLKPEENANTKNNKPLNSGMELEDEAKEDGVAAGNYKLQIELLEKQNKDLIKEQANLKKEIENLNLFKNNYEETFFKSKTFIDLVQQSQELLRYTNNMKAKLIAANKKIIEIEKLRTEELDEIFKKFKEEKQKLMEQIEKNSSNNSTEKNDLSNYFDISQFTKPLINSLEDANRNIETLKQEIQNLRKNSLEQKKKYDEELAKNMENMEKMNALTLELVTIKLQGTGHLLYDQLTFKHAKYKEILLEICEAVTKNFPMLKARFDELALYVKSRETKNEHFENKIKALNNELKNKQRQIEDLLNEIDLTGKGYTELLNTNKKLTEQIKDSDEIKAKMIKEKAMEKKQFDQEKSMFQIKYNAEKEVLQQQSLILQEIQKKEKLIEEYKSSVENENNVFKKYNEELKIQKEELVKKNEELKNEINLIKEKLEDIDNVNSKYIEKYEAAKKKLQLQQEIIEKLREATQDFKGTYQKRSTDMNFLKLEVEKYRKMIICNVCEKHEKNVCLAKCFHTFCKECLEKNIQLRKRMCPNCRTKFGQEDIKDIYWN